MFQFTRRDSQPKDIVALIDDPSRLNTVLSAAHTLARNRDERVQALVMSESKHIPEWFVIPDGCDSGRIEAHPIGRDSRQVLSFVNKLGPLALVIGLTEWQTGTRFLVSDFIDPIVHDARCTVCLLKAPPGWEYPHNGHTTFVPLWGDSTGRYALATALAANPRADITVGIPASLLPSDPESQDYQQQIDGLIHPWEDDPRVKVAVVDGEDETAAMVEKAHDYGFSLLGATRGNVFLRAIFGDPRHKFAERNPGVTVVVREYQGKVGSYLYRAWSRWERLMPSLGVDERAEIYRQVRRAGRPTRDFFMMIALSAGIASIGLVLNSPAVIIGAMLVAPLMSAIIGMGMAVVHGDFRFLWTCGKATLKGASVAIITGMVVGLVTPLEEATSEMLGRTEPTYLDLIVAIVSGVAGAYALSRKDVSGALPGVAIAVALVPPLATVGVTIAYGEFVMAWGALLLFLTNLTAITFASGCVFAALGFRPTDARITDREKARMTERSVLTAAVLVLVVGLLLVFETREKFAEGRTKQIVETLIPQYLDTIQVDTSFWNWRVEEGGDGDTDTFSIVLNASRSLTPEESTGFQQALSEQMEQEVNLVLSVLPTTIVRGRE